MRRAARTASSSTGARRLHLDRPRSRARPSSPTTARTGTTPADLPTCSGASRRWANRLRLRAPAGGDHARAGRRRQPAARGEPGVPAPRRASWSILVLTNEDDCSAPAGSTCSTRANTTLASYLGPPVELPLQRVRPPVQRRQAAPPGAERRRQRDRDAGRMRLGRGRRHADARRDDRVAASLR